MDKKDVPQEPQPGSLSSQESQVDGIRDVQPQLLSPPQVINEGDVQGHDPDPESPIPRAVRQDVDKNETDADSEPFEAKVPSGTLGNVPESEVNLIQIHPTQSSSNESKPDVKPGDTENLNHFVPNCTGNKIKKSLPTFEENMMKKAYIKEILLNVNAEENRSSKIEGAEATLQQHPEIKESPEFIKSNRHFQGAGSASSLIQIPVEELRMALDGCENMQLAHEIALNHDFRLEIHNPPCGSLEEQVRIQMKRAYWDIFDASISSKDPNPAHALSVFREMKQMLLNLLFPHNVHIKLRIQNFLDETAIQYEIDHHILEFSRYSDFIIHCLGQICCPMRDSQIADLKQLTKPSDIFKEIMSVMEEMQLDMANFFITNMRPTILHNCAMYERKKFAAYIQLQYKLQMDPLHITRAWILRHAIDERPPLIIIGKAFGETLNWTGDWPETLSLDTFRYAKLAEDVKRATYLGSAILSAFDTFRAVFGEGDDNLQPFQRGNLYVLRCFPLQDVLRYDLSGLIQNDDCSTQEKLNHVMDLMAEQAVQACNEFMRKNDSRELTDAERNMIRGSVRGCAREDHPVRMVLIRRVQEYATSVVASGKVENIAFPKGLALIEDSIKKVIGELSRLAVHNCSVFQDLYVGIAKGEVTAPGIMDNDNQYDLSMMAAMACLNTTPKEKPALTKLAKNEKLLNADGQLLEQSDDISDDARN